jgi:hypothetical protein
MYWAWFVEPVKHLADAVVYFVAVYAPSGDRVWPREDEDKLRYLKIPLPFGEVEDTLRKWAAGRGKR